MSSRPTREELENFLMTAGLSAIIAVAQVLIENPLISSIVIGISALAITAIFIRSRFGNYLFSYFNLKSSRQFHERSDIQHLLIHQTRDMCIKMMPAVPPYEAPPLVQGERALPHPLIEFHRSKIISLLEKEARLFQTLVPEGTRVWTCIRDRRSDDHYHTFARAGLYNPHRARDSQPLHKDNSRIISRLKDSYRDGKCVIITGAGAGPQVWEWQENDKYGEDKSVMLGAVITKSWDPNNKTWVNNKLAWVLGVCANVENAFDETHIPLMQACIDTFATLANVMIRSELINTQHGTEYRNDFPNGVYYGNGKKPMGYENLL